ncbi:MAG: flagellar hook-associated protein FlgK [Paracoccus sp. (in: a-proteobacteria)]|uniref:flagellar hook-associated protein FlgK n=1 Tax=Paracoccus sp. TaxID=267 RepID=UPI0026E071E6|nr:flagellar hook-associated protein FlgK [Paracoccus sp. (in: a-proteobacteria)]MDO5632167.1 flagellar hook-associated protein FlgK [Paracoccus sp. (in: a-proteobacteria)]
MNLTRALSNAVTGLQASGRGTETVSSNLANIMTPGYARREMAVSSQSWSGGVGGVHVNGINRIVNDTLVAENRSASGAKQGTMIQSQFLTSMEKLVGTPGETGSLSSALSGFQTALTSAASRPDDDVRLTQVVSAATTLARQLNAIGDGIQAARAAADQQIAADVANLNADLERVAELNRRISTVGSSGAETLSMEDERQTIIDRISAIIPVQQVERPGNKLALFATGGAILLDGSKPAHFEFTAAGQISADMTVDGGQLGVLSVDGHQISSARMTMLGGGTLIASFSVRDELAPQLQREIDAIALDLHDRLASKVVDPTLDNNPGFFTDNGEAASLASIGGLSSRIRINPAINPANGGEVWKVRDGLGATAPGSVGDGRLLDRISTALTEPKTMSDAATFAGQGGLDDFSGQFSSRLGTRRIAADAELAVRNARSTTLSMRLMADGVDSDAEMRRLLQYEHAYSANAKVIQTIDDMLKTLLSI